MKKNILLLSLLSLLGLITSCYDDSELRERIEKLENTTAVVINQQITALQSSVDALKSVDFDLKNEIASLENADKDHQAEIDSLKEKEKELSKKIEELQKGVDSLKQWVEDILKNYSTTEELNAQFAAVQEQINALNVQVAFLLATPDILFDVDGSIAYSPGTTVAVKYTLVNADETTEIECIADAGWKCVVTPAKDGKTGTISITTPSTGGEGKVLVFVSSQHNTVMRVLRFEQGTLTILTNSITVEPQDTILTIDACTNVDYRVVIPAEAQTWIELLSIDTRATMRTDIITLSIKQNSSSQSRSALIAFMDKNDEELSSFTIFQRADIQLNNEIWYTSTNGNIVEPHNPHAFGGANIVSNSYVSGKGVIIFDSDVMTIGNSAFQSNSSLKTISIPNSVTSIGESAFYECRSLISIAIPESVKHIGNEAFADCGFFSIIIPESVISIGDRVFCGCSNLFSISIPNSVTNIGYGVFDSCFNLNYVTIPNSISTINDYFFNMCYSLTSFNILTTVTQIRMGAFSGCNSLTSITIPESIKSIGYNAFSGCYGLTSVISLRTSPPSANEAFPNDVAQYCLLYVPYGSKNTYAAAEGWKNFKEIKELE